MLWEVAVLVSTRKIISKVGNFIAGIFLRLPITDYTNGFRAIKTNLLINLMRKMVLFI